MFKMPWDNDSQHSSLIDSGTASQEATRTRVSIHLKANKLWDPGSLERIEKLYLGANQLLVLSIVDA
jgi:hypothetical protein